MKKSIYSNIVPVTLALCCFAGIAAAQAGIEGDTSISYDDETGMEIRASLELIDSELVLNQPVLVRFKMENASSQPVQIDLGSDFKTNFEFSIVLPDGRTNKSRLPIKDGPSRLGTVTIEPQKSFSQLIVLNEWADLHQEGNYRVIGHLLSDREPTLEIGPFDLAFSISRSNAAQLAKVAEKYLTRIETASSMNEATELSLALTYMNSPVAVPYIKRALEATNVMTENLIDSLRTRGGVVAVDSLIAYLKDGSDRETVATVKAALTFILNTTTDSAIKKKIEHALQK